MTDAAHALAVPPGPTYDIGRSFEWNSVHGPAFEGPWPNIPATPHKTVLGLDVASRFGVAASVLTSARWVETYSRLGFDLLTYKTVRSVPWRCHEPANWLFLDETGRARLSDPDCALTTAEAIASEAADAFAAGSFGIPSSAPSHWEPDIARAKAALGTGQALVVSIVGTVLPESREEDVLADFSDLAARVRAAGADAVEANLSCPNVRAQEGEVFRDAALSGRIARAVRAAAGGAPVLLKIGHLPDPSDLRTFLRAVAGAADAVTMINAPSRRILAPDGSPAFGAGRERAGVMGDAIFPLAIEQLRRAVAIEDEDRLDLSFVAVGGVNSAARARAMIEAGAAAVQCASAAVWNPYLASEIKQAAPGI